MGRLDIHAHVGEGAVGLRTNFFRTGQFILNLFISSCFACCFKFGIHFVEFFQHGGEPHLCHLIGIFFGIDAHTDNVQRFAIRRIGLYSAIWAESNIQFFGRIPNIIEGRQFLRAYHTEDMPKQSVALLILFAQLCCVDRRVGCFLYINFEVDISCPIFEQIGRDFKFLRAEFSHEVIL